MGPIMKAEAELARGYIRLQATSTTVPGTVCRSGAARPGRESRTLVVDGSPKPPVACR